VITVDATPPRSFALPWVLVDLPNSKISRPHHHLKRQRLTAMGEAAAQAMLDISSRKPGI